MQSLILYLIPPTKDPAQAKKSMSARNTMAEIPNSVLGPKTYFLTDDTSSIYPHSMRNLILHTAHLIRTRGTHQEINVSKQH